MERFQFLREQSDMTVRAVLLRLDEVDQPSLRYSARSVRAYHSGSSGSNRLPPRVFSVGRVQLVMINFLDYELSNRQLR
jgi:hypothetical protein